MIEEVRKYEPLHDSLSRQYKDCQMDANLWNEISTNINLDIAKFTK